MTESELNSLSSRIIKAAINVHDALGPGLLENVYSTCMMIELEAIGLRAQREVAMPIIYRGRQVSDTGLRLDLLVEDTVIVELKSVEQVLPVHKKQLLSYLRLLKKPIGLLINFNNVYLKDGIHRIANSRFE